MSSSYPSLDDNEGSLKSVSNYFTDNDDDIDDIDSDECDNAINDDDQSKISPVRGRSVKEYDEQLTALKKENFNLKLRIYFLEERMGSSFRVEDKDNIIRKNIEYQVDIETLRKELDEKQDLLCQAVKALELEDSEHKRIISIKDAGLFELKSKIECLEQELKTAVQTNNDLQERNEKLTGESSQLLQEAVGLQIDKSNARDEAEKLREQLQELQLKLEEEKENNSILEHDNHELECLQIRCTNLESELKEKNQRVEELVNELEKNGHMVSSCNLRIRTLEDALTAKNSDIKYKDKEAANRDRIIQQQAAEIDELRRIVDERQALCDKEQRQTENLKSAVMARDNTIADLEVKNEKNKSVIRSLEAKLDSIVHENKRQNDELHAIKQQRRMRSDSDNMKSSPRKLNCSSPLSTSTSSSSNVEPIDTQDFSSRDVQIESWMQELYMKDVKLSKLEEDYRKACVLISNLLEQKKTIERNSNEIQAALVEKDKQIEELKRRRRINYISSSSHVSQNQHPEAENSVEECNENKNTEEESKMDVTTLEWEKQLEDLMEIIQEKEEELQNYKEKIEATLQEKDNRILELENEIGNLKSELNSVNKKLEETQAEIPDERNEKFISWMRVTKEKDKKIEQLECEVRKQTSNLQGIVNKELWDKNREIEKLQNRFTEKFKLKEQEISELGKEVIAKNMQLTMLKDKISELGIQVNLPSSLVANTFEVSPSCAENSEEMTIMKDQLKNSKEECKYLHKTVEELRQKLRNTPERERDSKINQLQIEHENLKNDFEKSEKLRQETVNLCSILTTRLEELAHFLDSLLKHRSVLGMLGSKQRSAIKQVVDQSLDLSKSLSMSIMNEDQCLTQLSSITGVLNTSENSMYNASLCELLPVDEYNASLTFNSHLNKHRGDGESSDKMKEQSDIIQILRAQIETMKKEIEIRDMELGKQNLNIPLSTDENKSLKNDLDLVNCIIDLQNKSCFNKKAEVMSPEKIYHNLVANKSCPAIMKSNSNDPNCSESEAWSEPDRCVSQARIGLDSEALKSTSCNSNRCRSTRSEILVRGASEESTEEEVSTVSNLKTPTKRGSTGSIDSRHTIANLQEKLGLFENKLREKENEILTLKTSILELDNKSLELKLTMSEEIAKLRNEKMDIEKLLKETEEKFKNVDLNNDEMLLKLKEMEEERDFALSSLQQYSHQVDLFESKTRELEIVLEEKQLEYNNNLKQIETRWQSYLEKQKLEQSELRKKEINDLKNEYEKEWIPKTEWNKQISEMKLIYHELEQIKNVLKSSENKIYIMEQAEQDLKRRLAESEDSNREKIIALKRELNESTLRASQAALERTKISNEKLKLEAEIRKLEIRETTKSTELEEQQKEYNNMKNNLQKQITQSEQQKSLLQLKVSELEALNAELHNRLVKLQTSDNVWLGNNPPKISDLVTNFKNLGRYSLDTRSNAMRQRNDFTSEDFTIDDSNNCFNRSAPETYHWLHQNVNHNANEAVEARVATNSSPDLGIESDQGRFSSLETNVTTTTRPLLQTLELTASMNNLLSANQVDNIGHYCNIIAHKELEKDNCELKRTISKLESNLEKTVSELSKINDKKVQVEKAVCKQIHKTSKVLRKARANLDSGSENEKRT